MGMKSRASFARSYSNYAHSWWTPRPIWQWAADTFRCRIEDIFDPCPTDWGPGDPSGLEISWRDPVLVNIPGKRGAVEEWWRKFLAELAAAARRGELLRVVWVMFNVEQIRHMNRIYSASLIKGWRVEFDDRVRYIWGGPDVPEKRDRDGTLKRAARVHGQPVKSPGNWSNLWTNCSEIAPLPYPGCAVRTGVSPIRTYDYAPGDKVAEVDSTDRRILRP